MENFNQDYFKEEMIGMMLSKLGKSKPLNSNKKNDKGESDSKLIARDVLLDAEIHRSNASYAESCINVKLYKNQADMVDAILNPEYKKIQILEPRQVGKTIGTAAACIISMEKDGEKWNAGNPEPFRIGIFSPSQEQSIHYLEKMKSIIKDRDKIDLKKTTKEKLVWHNGAEVHALSAFDTSNTVGRSFNIIILDEAQNISDYSVSEKILPMAAATNGKIVKIGTVSAFRNHFYTTWHNEKREWIHITHNLFECENLYSHGFIEKEIDGKILKLPNNVMGLMPKVIKQEIFPKNPELWTEGEMDITDFKTQYLLQWVDSYGSLLSGLEFEKLFGEHELQNASLEGEILVAGLDFAGSDSEHADETALSIIRVRRVSTNSSEYVKEKIFGITFKGDTSAQKMEIRNLLHPQFGRFKVKNILSDATGMGYFPTNDLIDEGLPIEGMMLGATNEEARLAGHSINNKTIIFSYAKNEIAAARFKYAKKMEHSDGEMYRDYYKGLDQWSNIEIKATETANKKIGHPPGGHDDICVADALAIYASKKGATAMNRVQQLNSIKPQIAHSPAYLTQENFRRRFGRH